MAPRATTRHTGPRLALGLDDAARALGISRRSIDRAVAEGRIRVVQLRPRGRRLVPIVELERVLATAAAQEAPART